MNDLFREGSPGNDTPKRFCQIYEKNENQIKIVFPFSFDDVNKVKTLNQRTFIPDGKFWLCYNSLQNIEKLKEWGFRLPTSLQTKVAVNVIPSIKPEPKFIDIPIPIVSGLKLELFPYQKVGVGFIELMKGRALIADEMGLGKTIQALAWLQLHPEYRTAIIIVPASLKLNWQREAKLWMSHPKCEILSGKKPYKTRGEILIINYDIVATWVPYLKTLSPKVLILDEIHQIKNSAAKRTKAVKQLAKGIPHVIGLSGTPIVNRPIEAYNALTIINSFAIPNFRTFTMRYCNAKHNGFGWDYTGASNTQELHSLLVNSFMIRRKKMEVLRELPDKRTAFVPIEIDNRDEYEDAELDFISYLQKTKGMKAAEKAEGAEILTKINFLKQLAAQGKLKNCIAWIEEFLESGEKLVLFCTHTAIVDGIFEHFTSNAAVKFTGQVTLADRNKAVDQFQNNPNIKLFVGLIDSQGQPAGVGITLTAAWSTATIEYQWSPGVHDQADDRIHRIGQKNACVNYKLMAIGTIEEKIAYLIDSKRKVLDSVLDGKQTEQSSLLGELMKSFLDLEDITKATKEIYSELKKQGNVTFGKKYDYLK